MNFNKEIAEVEKEIENWEKLIKIWNNKEFDEDIRRNAEREIDKLTDKGKGELILEAKLQTLKQCNEKLNNYKKAVEGVIDELNFLNIIEYRENDLEAEDKIKNLLKQKLQGLESQNKEKTK